MRPKAHGGRVVLLALLLVTSMVAAPIGTGTAAAQSDGSLCGEDSMIVQVMFGCWTGGGGGPVDPADQVDAHVISSSEWESYEAYHSTLSGRLSDSESVAYIDARNQIAESWENGSSESQAYQNARDEIRGYYSTMQYNHLQVAQKHLGVHGNTINKSRTTDIPDEFVHTSYSADWGADANSFDHSMTLLDSRANTSAELVNGTSVDIETQEVELWAYGETESLNSPFEGTDVVPFSPFDWSFNEDDDEFTYGVDISSNDAVFTSSLPMRVMNADEDGDLPSQTVWDWREWYELWTDMEDQSSEATAAFSQQMVSDLYAALDAGDVEPSDLRTAEGQQRWMSGESDTQEGDYLMALYRSLNLNQPDVENVSRMVVEYEGATEQSFDPVNESRERVLGGYVNGTYEGVLFASETPADGFEINETYDTGNLSGTTEMLTYDDERVTFYDGNLTVREMYDSDGNAVESTDWERPEPETYTSEDFLEYLDHVSETREESTNDGGDGGIDWGDLLPGGDLFEGIGDTASAVVGGVILVGVIAVIARVSGN